jgi:hypothetical protein
MQSTTKQNYVNKTCTQNVDKNSKNSIARMPPIHVQTKTQKCKVKENQYLKSQNSSSKDQRSMQSCNKAKELGNALKGLEVFPRG